MNLITDSFLNNASLVIAKCHLTFPHDTAMAPRIGELAATISVNTNTITNYLHQNSLPHPSFDADGPITLNLSPKAERARSTAIDALQELLDLLQGPIACMLPKVCTPNRPEKGVNSPLVQWHQPTNHLAS